VRGLRRTTRMRGHGASAHVGIAQAPATREVAGQGHRSRGGRGQGVGGRHRSLDVGDRGGARTRPSQGGPCWCELQEGTRPNASTLAALAPGLLQGVERAQRAPAGRVHALAPLMDGPALTRAYRRQRAEAAVGVDGGTKEQSGQPLEAPLQELPARLKAQPYRPPPIRRGHIPKGQGQTRPSGLSTCEDQVVQDVVREVLEALYEQDFLACSYGFRPGRSAHDAVGTLTRQVERGEGRWSLAADLVSCFDSWERTEGKKRLEVRGADGALLRLMDQGVHGGGLDGEAGVEPAWGPVQGHTHEAITC
jgi:Reverse transcriptase (RNA-dependent DNA polymerase)